MRFLLLLLLGITTAHAEWTLVSAERQEGTAPEIAFYRIVAKDATGRECAIDAVIFDDRKVALEVFDYAETRPKLDAAMAGHGALAGVNGGYFHSDYTPLGLVVAQGKETHGYEKANLLSGVLAMEPERLRVLRVAEFDPKRKIDAALQAGPFLVDGGTLVEGLNDTKKAKRTLVATDGGHRHALVTTGFLTLQETGDLLAQLQPLPDLKIKRALNLDGGTSTAIWVANSAGNPYYRPEWGWVRNFVGLVKR